MNPELIDLIRFALRTLEILEDDDAWDTATTDAIVNTAIAEGFIHKGVRTPKALNIPPP